jgi:hypothetical protein
VSAAPRLVAGLLALVAWCAGLPAAPAAENVPPAPLSDREILDRAATLPVEDLRYLVYLYARLSQPHLAEALAVKILSAYPSDRQTLLALASLAVEQKDAAAVLRLAHRYLAFYPGDHQGRYFLGAGHYLAEHYAEANAVLRELKHEQFIARPYPYETDLASAALAAGDWYRAMLSYQELLRHHALGDDLRTEVRRVLDGLYREHLPRLEASAASTRLNRARVWRYGFHEASHLTDRHWLDLRYTRDDVSLDAAPSLRAAHAPRAEAVGTLTTVYDRRWWSDASLGASREGLLAGARVHYRFAKEREVSLDAFGNERATDSLALEALDGRQHRAGLAVSWLIEADLVFLARANLRALRIGGHALGRGAGLDLTLDQTLTREGHGPRLTVGYRGSLATFSPDSTAPLSLVAPLADPAFGPPAQQALVANLVSRRLNRHGLGLLVADRLGSAWLGRFAAGADYDFALAAASWNTSLALSFFPRKSIELSGEFGYASSAMSSNAGSAAMLRTLFVRSSY